MWLRPKMSKDLMAMSKSMSQSVVHSSVREGICNGQSENKQKLTWSTTQHCINEMFFEQVIQPRFFQEGKCFSDFLHVFYCAVGNQVVAYYGRKSVSGVAKN